MVHRLLGSHRRDLLVRDEPRLRGGFDLSQYPSGSLELEAHDRDHDQRLEVRHAVAKTMQAIDVTDQVSHRAPQPGKGPAHRFPPQQLPPGIPTR